MSFIQACQIWLPLLVALCQPRLVSTRNYESGARCAPKSVLVLQLKHMRKYITAVAFAAVCHTSSAVPTISINDGTSAITVSNYTVLSSTANYIEQIEFTGVIGVWTVNITGNIFG